MDRREALKMGAQFGAGLALGGLGGCAPGARTALAPSLPSGELESRLGSWDRHWDEIGSVRFLEGFATGATGKPLTPEFRQKSENSEILFRDGMRTLFLTQSFRDLPEADRFRPEVQERMHRNIDVIDNSVQGMTDMLERLPPGERENVRATIRKHPGLAMRISEVLDGYATRSGVSRDLRLKFRSAMTQTSFRLSRHDPSVVIDEYVAKVKRASEAGPEEIRASRMADQAAGPAFWRFQEAAAFAEKAGVETVSGDTPYPGKKALHAGAKMLGIGVATFGISMLFVSGDVFVPFVFTATAGAILIAIGILTLIVGAIMAISAD
jgi:hypothetical protein